ncbi:hypothetical protein J7643_09330 [bacterium]|nr:hypothetical protein [bacterium]
MTLRDRLRKIMDEGDLVELFFAPTNNYYLARITRVGQDYIEFDACDEEENVVAHNLMPLQLLIGITTSSIDRNREKLELLLRRDAEGGQEVR